MFTRWILIIKFLNKTNRHGHSMNCCPDYHWLYKNVGWLVTVSEAVKNLSEYPRQNNGGTHLILRVTCSRPGCAGEWAGNSARVIPTVCVQQSLSFSVTPRLWWDTSALRPLPSLPQPFHILPAFFVRQTCTGTAPPIHCRHHPICQKWQTHGLKCLFHGVPHMLRHTSMTFADWT